MKGSVKNIEEFHYDASQASWVNQDGNHADSKKQAMLHQAAEESYQKQVMERLEISRASFHCMSSDQERKAAHEWLRAAYGL